MNPVQSAEMLKKNTVFRHGVIDRGSVRMNARFATCVPDIEGVTDPDHIAGVLSFDIGLGTDTTNLADTIVRGRQLLRNLGGVLGVSGHGRQW